jgi:hypothetical protein
MQKVANEATGSGKSLRIPIKSQNFDGVSWRDLCKHSHNATLLEIAKEIESQIVEAPPDLSPFQSNLSCQLPTH